MDARVVKLEAALLSFGPCALVVPQLFVAADSDPEHVVLDVVAVQELDRGSTGTTRMCGTNSNPF